MNLKNPHGLPAILLAITAADCQSAPAGATFAKSVMIPAGSGFVSLLLGDGSPVAFDDGAGSAIVVTAAIGALTTGAIEVDSGAPALLPVGPTGTPPLLGQTYGVAEQAFSITLTVTPTPVAAVAIGTTDTTNGALYGGGGLLDGTSFTYEGYNPGDSGPLTVTLTAPADATDLVSQINAVIYGFGPFYGHAAIVANRLRIDGIYAGAGGSISLFAGSPDALAILGIAADTYTGSTPTGNVRNITSGAIIAKLLTT